MVVGDTHADLRLCRNPYVVGPPAIRSYAGVVLRAAHGTALGTVFAVDTKPRSFGLDVVQRLNELATCVIGEFEQQLAHRLRLEALSFSSAHQSLLPQAPSIDSVLQTVVSRLAELLGLSIAEWLQFDSGRYVRRASVGVEQSAEVPLETVRHAEIALRSAEPVVTSWPEAAKKPTGRASHFAAAVKLSSMEPVGVLFGWSPLSRPRTWSSAELALVSSCAECLLNCLQHKRSSAVQRALAGSEPLLKGVVPDNLVFSGKSGGEKQLAQRYDNVTLMFCQINKFDLKSAKRTHEQVIETATTLFGTFDQLAQAHKLSRVRVSGDTYVAAAGLPLPNTKHAECCLEMAVNMLSMCAELSGRVRMRVKLKIGIASGPLVVGVVGTSRPSFDVYGELAALASALQQSCQPATIRVHDSTWALIKEPLHYRRADDDAVAAVNGPRGQTGCVVVCGRNDDAARQQASLPPVPPEPQRRQPTVKNVKNLPVSGPAAPVPAAATGSLARRDPSRRPTVSSIDISNSRP
eukprot:TRINITY_DN6005_c0_g1_i1.p1 TRINITY_DN6005_c0_g1~~TRINITY_DN6005_c0_g1_i1.p1  ORF type:complete len:521 (-),score=209.44 TRINITY_DN6005_c0_g1_i1:679-2241(-)